MSALRLALWVFLAGCPSAVSTPGAEHLGTYAMLAEPTFRACALSDVLATEFSFEATVSRDPTSGHAWVTLANYSRDASWDGQTLESVATAPRSFTGTCTGCPMALQETIRVELLSQSQNSAAGDRCPDGEAPAADDDAGIRTPGPDRFGYDAVRACGVLETVTLVTAAAADGGACDPTCGDCRVQYRLTGVRQ